VLDPDGYAVAAISVAAPAMRTSQAEIIHRAKAPLLARARELGLALSAVG